MHLMQQPNSNSTCTFDKSAMPQFSIGGYSYATSELFTESAFNATVLMTSPATFHQYELRIIYSKLENILFQFYFYSNGLIAVILNFLVIASIVRIPLFRNPEGAIILSDSINNIVFTSSFHSFALALLQSPFPQPNYYICQISGVVSSVSFLTTASLSTIYAYERYLFFCDPTKHAKLVTTRRVVGLIFGIVTLSCCWNVVINWPDRVLSYTALMCMGRYQLKPVVVNFILYGVSSIVVATYSVINIQRALDRYATD
jgi:hypothetical protein